MPTDRTLAPLKAKARAITDGIESKILPDPLLPCIKTNFSKNSGRAKSCGIPESCKKYFEMGTKAL